MPPNTPVFLLGLAVGASLLVFGLLLGYWLGRRAAPASSGDRQQFLNVLKNLSNWTSEFSGDVSNYQNQLTSLNEKVLSTASPARAEMLDLLSKIMQANRELQQRLDTAEQKLEVQTDQISNYLTEARTDGLTGLFNRRAFDKTIDELFVEWTRKQQPFSLCLIDIDHFKQINDTYGHPAGDAVLQHLSSLLQTELDDAVCVARYGGEEFALLTKAPLESAAATLDRLRQTISETEFSHEGSIIPVTLSGGAAAIQNDDQIGRLVRRADEALYAAKLAGRNRVYLHDGTICHLITEIAPVAPATVEDLPSADDSETPAEKSEFAASTSRVQERLQRIIEEESQRLLGRTSE